MTDTKHPREITYAEWEAAVRHGYARARDGNLFVLTLDKETQATVLEPVTVPVRAVRAQGGPPSCRLPLIDTR